MEAEEWPCCPECQSVVFEPTAKQKNPDAVSYRCANGHTFFDHEFGEVKMTAAEFAADPGTTLTPDEVKGEPDGD